MLLVVHRPHDACTGTACAAAAAAAAPTAHHTHPTTAEAAQPRHDSQQDTARQQHAPSKLKGMHACRAPCGWPGRYTAGPALQRLGLRYKQQLGMTTMHIQAFRWLLYTRWCGTHHTHMNMQAQLHASAETMWCLHLHRLCTAPPLSSKPQAGTITTHSMAHCAEVAAMASTWQNKPLHPNQSRHAHGSLTSEA